MTPTAWALCCFNPLEIGSSVLRNQSNAAPQGEKFQFQSPRNRVKCSELHKILKTEESLFKFQSPRNRVKCSE